MTVVFPQLAKGAACILPSHCNEAIQNQYSGKNTEYSITEIQSRESRWFSEKVWQNQEKQNCKLQFLFLLSS